MMTDVKTSYPDRYYAAYNVSAPQPTPVTAWYDTWDMGNLENVPPASSMIPISKSDWDAMPSSSKALGYGVRAGKLIEYTAPGIALPITTQAADALSVARDYCTHNFLLLNEATPDEWVTYIKALTAITSGTDTTSTVLPTSPLDQTAPKTPAALIKQQLEDLGALLVTKQESGFYFTPTGATTPVLFSTSVKAQTQYGAANTLAKENPDTSQDFIELSGVPITLTGADTIALTTKVAQYVSDCYTVYTKMFDAIASGKTVDTSTGWPANS